MNKKQRVPCGISTAGIGELIREQKNYSKETEQLIKSWLEKLWFEREGVLIYISKVYSVNGHAEISIRKGK